MSSLAAAKVPVKVPAACRGGLVPTDLDEPALGNGIGAGLGLARVWARHDVSEWVLGL